jgi:hypothetical protein
MYFLKIEAIYQSFIDTDVFFFDFENFYQGIFIRTQIFNRRDQ